MDGSPCNIKAPCLAMPTVPLLSEPPALPASRPSALPSSACPPVCLFFSFKDVSLLQMIGDTPTKEYRAAVLGPS
ncbi:hypothetical protein JOQ06_008001 [Pogonophryne albipinna]|uniref:Uncharacterized protein n=1 Tax=Pogonophryne albipinna TaxID=1090488 RepID=A0AAD6F9N0_9TELE|nr:hypothetical protein JOQ06_008001 [Pogonophryne albipinna]